MAVLELHPRTKTTQPRLRIFDTTGSVGHAKAELAQLAVARQAINCFAGNSPQAVLQRLKAAEKDISRIEADDAEDLDIPFVSDLLRHSDMQKIGVMLTAEHTAVRVQPNGDYSVVGGEITPDLADRFEPYSNIQALIAERRVNFIGNELLTCPSGTPCYRNRFGILHLGEFVSSALLNPFDMKTGMGLNKVNAQAERMLGI